MNEQFIQGLSIDWNKIDAHSYLRKIDALKDLEQLECTSLVTSGKFYNAKTAADLVRSLNNSVNSFKSVDAKILY